MRGDPAGRSVRYFLHVATLGRYDEIMAETLAAILASPDLGPADSITIGVVGGGTVSLPRADPRISVVRNGDDVTQYEFPTLDMIHAAAQAEPAAAYVYFNCLGGRYMGGDYLLRARWRAMLLYLLVERRPACLTLLDRHDVIGVEWTPLPLPHMTSNNWMARGGYIATLPAPAAFAETVIARDLVRFGPRWQVAEIKRRHAGEFWIGADFAARPHSLLPISRMGLPTSEFGSAPWWALPGIRWRDLAMDHYEPARPGASRVRFAVQAAGFRLLFLARAVKRAMTARLSTKANEEHRV